VRKEVGNKSRKIKETAVEKGNILKERDCKDVSCQLACVLSLMLINAHASLCW
jgi:hypothetical protein